MAEGKHAVEWVNGQSVLTIAAVARSQSLVSREQRIEGSSDAGS